jgi:hypothetical protein
VHGRLSAKFPRRAHAFPTVPDMAPLGRPHRTPLGPHGAPTLSS